MIYGMFIGAFAMFMVQRVVDAVCKKGGRECRYDCSICTTRCNGYHCGMMRQSIANAESQAVRDLDEVMDELENPTYPL